MGYNHKSEENKFNKNWIKNKENYTALGMSDKQINEIYKFDLNVFRSDRRFYERKSENDNYQLECFDSPSEHFLEENWIEYLSDVKKYERLSKLPRIMRKAFYMNKVQQYTQREISLILSIPQTKISFWIVKIAEILS